MRTENPTLRITRWLRSRRETIPFEAECSACADAQFKIKYDKRSEGGRCHGLIPPYALPDGDLYWKILQREFEEHLKVAHASEGQCHEAQDSTPSMHYERVQSRFFTS